MGTKEPHSAKANPFKVEKADKGGRRNGSADTLTAYGRLGDIVECVISAGAYISFGRTTDGGATVIRILDGPDKLTAYKSSHEELEEAFEALLVRYAPTSTKASKFTVTPPLKQLTIDDLVPM